MDDGVRLLRELGVEGPDDELRQAVEDYRGHAYSLMLLGTYLHDATDDHDIRRRRDLPALVEGEAHDHHAYHMFEAYQRHLGDDRAELAVLRLLGFFDRPAARELIDVLRAPEGGDLESVTRPLLDLSNAEWNRVLNRLQGSHLLDAGEDGSLDNHPLLREFFAAQLREDFQAAFRAAGYMDYLPCGLLTRAWARHAAGDVDGCKADLDEAQEIAERGGMKLHMTDVLLYRARLFRDRSARDHAAALVEETGYHRRDEELEQLANI